METGDMLISTTKDFDFSLCSLPLQICRPKDIQLDSPLGECFHALRSAYRQGKSDNAFAQRLSTSIQARHAQRSSIMNGVTLA